MAVFPGADQAAEAAAEMQARISEQPPVGRVRLAIRVGFHFGPAIAVEGDVFGDSVNVAARMAALAKGEQVILSAATADALSPLMRARVREIDSLTVKGKQEEIGIFELIWQGADADLTSLAMRPARRPSRLQLRHGTREIELDDDPHESHARPRRAERRRGGRQDGVADARAHRAPAGQVRADRPELERHVRHRRRRARNPSAARGTDPARPRPCLLRPRAGGMCSTRRSRSSASNRRALVRASVGPAAPARASGQACRGSSASRRPSPTRLNESTSTKIDTPGQIAIHGALSM